jgi:histone H3/H4
MTQLSRIAKSSNQQLERTVIRRLMRAASAITISGKLGDDAKQYQIRAVKTAIAEVER